MRAIVDTIPALLLVILVAGGVVGTVLAAVWAVRRLVPSTREGFDAEVSSQMPGVVASIVILAYVTLVGSRSVPFHMIGAGSIAVVVGFALVVLLLLQFPFSGGLAVDSTPLRQGALATLLAGSK